MGTTTTPTTSTTTTPLIIIVTSVTTTTPTITTTTASSCMTDGGAKIGLPCVFPFTTNTGVTYTSCTTDGGFAKPWCSTATDVYGNHVIGNWGDCNIACTTQTVATAAAATCTTVRGADRGSKCVFPFTHKGVVP